jgi:hypothetical protein
VGTDYGLVPLKENGRGKFGSIKVDRPPGCAPIQTRGAICLPSTDPLSRVSMKGTPLRVLKEKLPGHIHHLSLLPRSTYGFPDPLVPSVV